MHGTHGVHKKESCEKSAVMSFRGRGGRGGGRDRGRGGGRGGRGGGFGRQTYDQGPPATVIGGLLLILLQSQLKMVYISMQRWGNACTLVKGTWCAKAPVKRFPTSTRQYIWRTNPRLAKWTRYLVKYLVMYPKRKPVAATVLCTG